MRFQGITVFLIFFGIATLDALTSGSWPRIAFWIVLGVGFALLDLWSDPKHAPRR